MNSANAEPNVALLRASGPDAYILALAASFPCLEGKVEDWRHGRAGRVGKFDADDWMEWQAPWSRGEKHAAYFVVNVWDPGYAQTNGWHFNLFDACGVWDNENRAAAMAWIAAPVWP